MWFSPTNHRDGHTGTQQLLEHRYPPPHKGHRKVGGVKKNPQHTLFLIAEDVNEM